MKINNILRKTFVKKIFKVRGYVDKFSFHSLITETDHQDN